MQRAFRPTVQPLEDRLVPTAQACNGNIMQALSILQARFSALVQSSVISSTTNSSSTNSASAFPFATITATLKSGVLNINGSAGADQITLCNHQKMIHVIGTGQAFRAADVWEIVIHGRGGNVVIDLRGLTLGPGRACTLFGDAGNDMVFGGSGADIIHGGAGDDRLSGKGGNDQIFGDYGKDSLEGRQGDDFLDGGLGRDLVMGGIGADTLVAALDSAADLLDGGAGLDTVFPT